MATLTERKKILRGLILVVPQVGRILRMWLAGACFKFSRQPGATAPAVTRQHREWVSSQARLQAAGERMPKLCAGMDGWIQG